MFNFLKPANRPAPVSMTDIIKQCSSGDMVLIDVREPGEIAASGAAAPALRVPLATLRMRVDPSSPECLPQLRQGKPVAVYCASGARSAMAASTLNQLGHEAHNVGGFGHWRAAGGAVAR